MNYPTAIDEKSRARLDASYVVEPEGCWRWVKGLTSAGYGHFHYAGGYYQAHRFLYTLHVSPVPAGLDMDHLCRNRWCVNPAHLEAVTRVTNIRRGKHCRLTPDKVRAIREFVWAGGASYRRTALMFGLDHSTVARIANGQRWGDIPEERAA